MLRTRTPAPIAGHVAPCLPSPAKLPPAGPGWIHEIKHDGFRLMARRQGGRLQLFTRNGFDFRERYPQVAAALAVLRVRSCLIDGEAVAQGADGLSDFDALRFRRRDGEVALAAFDLLELNGEDLRGTPLQQRKARLAEILFARLDGMFLVEHLDGAAEPVFRAACRLGCEGIVSKRLGSRYVSGRTADWIKLKNLMLAVVAVLFLNSESREAWPGSDTLATLLNVDERSIPRLLDRSEARGHIRTVHRGGAGPKDTRRFAATLISMTGRSSLTGGHKKDDSWAQKARPASHPTLEGNNEVTRESAREIFDAFDEFWAIGPRKLPQDSKMRARHCFERLARDIDPSIMITGLLQTELPAFTRLSGGAGGQARGRGGLGRAAPAHGAQVAGKPVTRREYRTPGDLVGKLEFLELVCDRCSRRGRYRVDKLLEELGPDGNLADWRARVTADCPQRGNMSDPCGAHSPDLVRLF